MSRATTSSSSAADAVGQDHINGCDRKIDVILADGSPEYNALLPFFGPTPSRRRGWPPTVG